VPLSPKSIGSGASAVAVSEAISGLAPGTTYHYRVLATNEVGETEGADQTFTTRKAPIATTEAATGLSASGATLNAVLNPEGLDTTYQFEFGKTSAYGSKIPASPKSIGSGTSAVAVSEAINGLEASTTYHYRVVAANEVGTTSGNDATFKTEAPPVSASQLGAMATTEPFNGSSTSLSNFNAHWSTLGWASGASPKGADTTTGWHPSNVFPTVNGTFYNPVLTDTGSGVAAEGTMATNPAGVERYFSLWLDMSTPSSTTRAGYELRFTIVAENTYNVTLSKWQGGTKTILASKANFAFLNGNSFAIVDQGATVTAWTNTGQGFTQLLSASDASLTGGNTGLEGAGNLSRFTNFKAGVPLSGVANMDAALKGLELNDAFATSELPLSGGDAWAALAWDDDPFGFNTGQVAEGWGPFEAFPTTNGAFWQKASFADTGPGDAVAATLAHNPTISERHFSLWLDMPSPASVRSGYELRLTEVSTNSYEVTLSRWQGGSKTLLASKAGYAFPTNSQFALLEKGGVVSAWTKTATEYTQLLSAADATFTSGYTGIEGSGNITRLRDFRSGPLAPF
jgi:hypothetical protein